MKVGLAVTLLLFAALASYAGTPHWLYHQRCQSYDGRSCAYVIVCDYVGVQGWLKIEPEWQPDFHRCPGIAWFPLKWPLFERRKG